VCVRSHWVIRNGGEPLNEVVDGRLAAAIGGSFLSELADDVRSAMLERSRMVRIPRGQILDPTYTPFAGVVVTGLMRVVSTDRDRPLTYRNVLPGQAVGLARLIGMEDEVYIQAITPSEIIELDLRQVAELRQQHAAVSLALAREVLRRLRDTSLEIEVWARGSVRQRVARQLLDLAAEDSRSEVRVSHEALAETIGSRREVVTRALAALASSGAISLGRGSICIADPMALRRELPRAHQANDQAVRPLPAVERAPPPGS
jgi:CRP/FNR family transcriptional regulator, cyclic AMP receptor protein